jgi:hypothetical protein
MPRQLLKIAAFGRGLKLCSLKYNYQARKEGSSEKKD